MDGWVDGWMDGRREGWSTSGYLQTMLRAQGGLGVKGFWVCVAPRVGCRPRRVRPVEFSVPSLHVLFWC